MVSGWIGERVAYKSFYINLPSEGGRYCKLCATNLDTLQCVGHSFSFLGMPMNFLFGCAFDQSGFFYQLAAKFLV